MKQWSIVVDMTDGNWEATVMFTDGRQYHYESTDPVTLMAAIGRDLHREEA